MRALQLDAAALSEVRRQRTFPSQARAIFGKTEGRIASVDREGNTVRTTSEADYRQANGLSVAQNSMTASAYLIRGAPESCVEQATKSSFEKVCASLDSAMKLSLAQPESEFDRVNSACGPASPTRKRDSVDLNSGVTSVLYACIRDALRSVVDVERAVVSDASATPPGRSVGTSENGPGQHVPGFPRRGDASRPFCTTAGGYRGGCEVDRTDARHRFCDALPPVVHYGVVCDECETTVRGRRFKCMTCTDYDLCNSCKLMGHHSYHNFRRIASPVPVVMVPNVHVVCRYCADGTTVDGRHQSCECLLSSRRGYSHQSCCMSGHTAVAPVRAASAEQAPADPAERAEVERPAVHENVWCDVCDRTIIGARFKCGNCDDFDLCSDCEAKTDHDSDHVFLKIRRPVAIKGVRIVYSPTGAPDIYQEVQQALTVSTDISANACPAFVEGPTEPTSASIHDPKGSETVAVQKCDRIVATDQPNTVSSETPMPPDVIVVQGDDTRVATLRTADPAASFAHSNVSDDFGPKVVDGCSVHAKVENGAVALSGNVVSSAPTRSAEIEDEFVMVSPADDLPERAVAEIRRAESPNCEVDERAHCSLPTAVPSSFSLEAADASTAEDRPLCPACSWSAVASAASQTCANPAAAAADNRNRDGNVEQVGEDGNVEQARENDVGQPNHADHGGSDVDEHRDIIGKMEEHLLILKEMGFRNRAFVELLLQQHKGDTIKSCPCCVLETDC